MFENLFLSGGRFTRQPSSLRQVKLHAKLRSTVEPWKVTLSIHKIIGDTMLRRKLISEEELLKKSNPDIVKIYKTLGFLDDIPDFDPDKYPDPFADVTGFSDFTAPIRETPPPSLWNNVLAVLGLS